ncbi:hypothetical protein M3Y95_00374700 [Aphelenchoides besseyi]|nr:hypothetical protein M3Y95_00374700 [Aphelenchoides besseyi]
MFVFFVYTALLLHLTSVCQKTKRKSKTDRSCASSHARYSSRKEANERAEAIVPVVSEPPKVEMSERLSIRATPESNDFSPKSPKKRADRCVQKPSLKLEKQKIPLDKTRKTTTVTMADRTIQTEETQIPTENPKTAIDVFKEKTQSTDDCSLKTDATTDVTQNSPK